MDPDSNPGDPSLPSKPRICRWLSRVVLSQACSALLVVFVLPSNVSARQEDTFQERSLLKLPKGAVPERVALSPYGRLACCLYREAGKLVFLASSGSEPRVLDEIGGFNFSPDGRRFACRARIGTDWHLLTERGIGEAFDQVGYPDFSPDSRSIAYAVRKGKESWLILDGRKLNKPFDEVEHVTYGPDSKQLAFSARRGDEWFVVHQDQPSQSWEAVKSLCFSPSGKACYVGLKRGLRYHLVVGDSVSEPFEWIKPPATPFPFADEEKVLFVAERGKKRIVVHGAAIGAEYDEIEGLTLDARRRDYAFLARTGTNWHLVWAGKAGPPFPEVLPDIHFSDDNTTSAYRASVKGKWAVVAGDRVYGSFDFVGQPVFRHGTKDVMFSFREGTSYHLMLPGGVRTRAFEAIYSPYSSLVGKAGAGLQVSPDGSRVAFGALSEGAIVWKIEKLDR